jgi:hypothetical protein
MIITALICSWAFMTIGFVTLFKRLKAHEAAILALAKALEIVANNRSTQGLEYDH